MSKGGLTEDEKFIIALYEMTQQQADPEEPLDAYIVGQSIGMQTRRVDAISTQLMRTNFLKRQDKHFVYLTTNGVNLAKQLLENI
ncbi:MAG: hypothetical protein WC222_10190 [Parachlamydiales bacterium]|jgi:hypothetical protein